MVVDDPIRNRTLRSEYSVIFMLVFQRIAMDKLAVIETLEAPR